MAKVASIARMTTATTGTGTITLGAAVASYNSFANAGIANGDIVSYAIEDGNNREIGIGTYTAAGTTLTRTVLASTAGGAAINLSGSAQVFITPGPLDLSPAVAWAAYTPTFSNWTQGNGTVAGRWIQVGKTVHFKATFTFGSTSVAASADPRMTLPVAAQVSDNAKDFGARFYDVSATALYAAGVIMQSTTVLGAQIIGTSGLQANPTTTTPFTWATGDLVFICGTYEAA